MLQTEYLVDLLASASIDAPAGDYVDLEKMILARGVETAIFQHPPSSIAFPSVKIGHNAKLVFAIGIKEVAWPLLKSAVRFIVSIESDGRRRAIFKARLNPRKLESDRAWVRHELDFSEFAGQSVRLVFTTKVGWRRSTKYGWAGWANPRIVHEVPVVSQQRRHDRHPHIFLLTADALPARYLGCYGDPQVKTPGLEALAADGVLFEQAWSQSCMTLGSYASILTGLYPHEHGISREWQTFPVSKMNLATALKQHGYHTVFAASSRELSGRTNYLDQVFDEVLHTLSNPMQDGAVTNRQFMRWFAQRPDQPCFSWIHYFDVHPPSMAPAPFSSLYYSDDPMDPRNEHRSSEVQRIRAVESALIMRAVLPLMERGEPVAEAIDILEDTAAVLKDRSDLRPDLAEHVLNLGACAMRGESRDRFGEWLRLQTEVMRDGRVPAELLQWIKDVIKLLENTEQDITSWLRGVVDFRYPLAVYYGTVSYFDSQIDALVSHLKEQDLYDQSLIIVTAPHGEILDDSRLPYHHFLLTPDTLHVPLIMKLPEHHEIKRGVRIEGVFDLIDLFPTIMDIQGLSNSFALSGVSRWKEMKAGGGIPPHDSFAAGLHQLSHSVCRPPNLLVRERPRIGMAGFHSLVGGASEILYNSTSGEVLSSVEPESVASLRLSVDAHAAKSQVKSQSQT
jgi:hypothetical protein